MYAMANNHESAPLIERDQQSEDNLHVIDIPTADEDLEPRPECCIYEVPTSIRIANEDAYTPQLISIGPLHHGKEKVARMELQKRSYYKKFSKRTSKEMLEEFSRFIEKNMKRICGCYDMVLVFKDRLDASKFIKMILYDAVFIIELFLRHFEKEVSDFLLSKQWVSQQLSKDLILLENQLPFFLLEDLYNLAFAGPFKPSFPHLACSYFDFEDDTLGPREIKHFTDLVRSVVVMSSCPRNSDVAVSYIYSATMLREAGVRFKPAYFGGLLDIKFDKGVLHIPEFVVNLATETIIRNLMAYEQCHDLKNAYICSFVQLLDYLIDTDRDVDILVKQKILLNLMGSNQAVADMINKLMVGVVQLTSCYEQIGEDLNQYYDNSWNRNKATLKHVYFNNLWRGTATVAAFIVVVLTLIQTIMAILDRAKPTKN